MKPLVSILIPAYNAETWISETLQSAVAQTWPRKEIIVVDDGSRDRTLEIARKFESEFFKIVSQENQGAAAARNKAFSVSQGDYIQWLDADDLISPNKIADQIEALGEPRNPRMLLSGAWGQFHFRYSRTKFDPTPLWCDLTPTEWLTRKMEHNTYMQTAAWLVSRELTEAAGPWDTRLLGDDDGEYFCRVLLASDGVRFVPSSKVYYRAAGATSLSYIGTSDRKMVAQWRSMELHIRYIRSLEDSERVRKACVTYLQNWLVFFYPDRPDLVKQAEEMAESLGGQLHAPPLSWKYSWIATLFGRSLARRAQIVLPRIKWSMVRRWDKAMFRVEGRKFGDTFAKA
ncbi:MAG TPA: glycosyltransferase family 2 protein [Candidatus Baltobacteraceae bacterium]|nr:glycosyltransferase family 2 protein [Candidatus Baltobacteraceae bacterium]